jgi:hypothetical protein
MITALVALASVLLGCAVVTVIQLAIIIGHLADVKAYAHTNRIQLQHIADNTRPHLPPEEL